eukprot:TRINITY_DN2061_c0_g1_i1.p1 TRINITY_DN2061_c0_g1~~TRINITY_DN2061_c0_g1_i1.p1  ORF type:complete len:353 (+),score=80.15 TRINITY_DN2061_c0_g1_i1:75-1133(+)
MALVEDGWKRKGSVERRRGDSLLDTVNAGACSCQGCRNYMEDVHRVIMWKGVQCEDIDCDCDELPAKRQKISNENPIKEQTTTTKTTIEPEQKDINKDSDSSSSTKEHEMKVSFFVVCDGHGGIQAAEFVNTNLFNNIVNQREFQKNPTLAILEGFKITEDQFTQFAKDEDLDGMIGTTVTALLLVGNTLYVANLGDSEAVICSNGQETVLTQSHIPSNPVEKDRIERLGGSIIADKKGMTRLAHPVWNGGLVNIGVTRAIGDLYFKHSEFVGEKKSGLIATPSLRSWDLTVDDQFVIIASDGFWDVVSPKEATTVVHSKLHLDSNLICQDLLELSKTRKTTDNVTVLLVKL